MSGKKQELNLDDLDKVTGGDLGDLGETESLRLQMAMDNKSKLLETLSNVLKEESNTASAITKNLK